MTTQQSRRAFGALALTAGGLALASAPATAAPLDHDTSGDNNKAIVREAFARQNSGGSFYDILHDRVTWTVVNGRTYRSKKEFLDEGAAPILTRLKTILRMTPSNLLAARDTVVAQFTGEAIALDGRPYRNDYCWVLTFRRGLVVRAHAYLDTVAIRELMDRVNPGS
ncbi:nuclear transport factor 2 family protein [Nonomuraea sp. NPDC046802]|uniref:nuclear transport factor 2 family protein n=1 Tax=Nonomuraea sp. NPDC046802 TaxID=3154919 RepID=UPI0033D57893